MAASRRGAVRSAALGIFLAGVLTSGTARAQVEPQTLVTVSIEAYRGPTPAEGGVPVIVEARGTTLGVELRYHDLPVMPTVGLNVEELIHGSTTRVFYVFPGQPYTLRARDADDEIHTFNFTALAPGSRIVVGAHSDARRAWSSALRASAVLTQIVSPWIALYGLLGLAFCWGCDRTQYGLEASLGAAAFVLASISYGIAAFVRNEPYFRARSLRDQRPGVSLGASLVPTPGGGVLAASLTF